MKVVLDTNIYIALALHGEFIEDLFEIITKMPNMAIITSEEILEELEQKLGEKFNWQPAEINLFLTRIRKMVQIVTTSEKISVITRDPDDNKILECAIAGEAELVVTVDQDLIKLKNFRGVAIIHPKTLTWTFPEYFKKN